MKNVTFMVIFGLMQSPDTYRDVRKKKFKNAFYFYLDLLSQQ